MSEAITKPILLDLFSGAGGAAKGYQRAGFYVVGVDHKFQKRYCGDEFIQGDALAFLASAIESGYVNRFAAVHASPPCQAHTPLRKMWNAKKHQDLIPQTRALLIESGLPFVMENVPGAPLIHAPLLGTWRTALCGTMFGLKTDCGAELRRHRLFELNWNCPRPPACQHGWTVIGVYGGHVRDRCRVLSVTGHTATDHTAYKRERVVVDQTADHAAAGRIKTITVTGSTPQQNVVRNRVRKTFSIGDAQVAMGIDWMPMSALSQAIPPAFTCWIGSQLIAQL